MRRLLLAGLLALGAGAPLAAAPPARAVDDPAELRKTVEAPGDAAARVKAATSLAKVDPESLGDALLAVAKAKRPEDVPFLVDLALKTDVRHLRTLAVHAAWRAGPEAALAAFRERTAGDDLKASLRAVEALGLVAAAQKDRSAQARLLEILRGPKEALAVEACRAIARSGDKSLGGEVADAVSTVGDEHVRKHAVWTLQDLIGKKNAQARLASMKFRPGDPGKRAGEGEQIVLDEEEKEFAWDPAALSKVPAWWEKQRPKGLKPEIAIGDKDMRERIQAFLEFLAKKAPAWDHFARSSFAKIQLRTGADRVLVDPEKGVLMFPVNEILQVNQDWKGGYLLARDACMVFQAALGEPHLAHRGWEPAYVEMHSYYLNIRETAGEFWKFVTEAVAKKPW